MKKLSPYLIIILSFLTIIVIGSLLLALPVATKTNESLPFIDSFFIATSAVTITGLSPITNLSVVLSPFGKVILAILIQVGGLSVVTLSVFILILLGAKIGISNRLLIKESLNQNHLSGLVRLVIKIVLFTFAIELLGFVINLFVFLPEFDTKTALGLSAFHAISAFNNAGFDLFGPISMQFYQNHLLLNINTSILIMLGGLGFIVIDELFEKKSLRKLSLHSKVVLLMNLCLWTFGLLLFKFSGTSFTWLQAFFMSVSARTAGFSTINMQTISSFATLIFIILMFIGASPSSTGGGVKTTTIFVMFSNLFSFAKGKQPTAFKRFIGEETRYRAATLVFTALLIIVVATLLLLHFNRTSLETALFETTSAFANVGLSRGLTSSLTIGSKVTLIVVMFIGRVGPLTVLSLLNRNWYKKELYHIKYIEEKMIIG